MWRGDGRQARAPVEKQTPKMYGDEPKPTDVSLKEGVNTNRVSKHVFPVLKDIPSKNENRKHHCNDLFLNE